MYPKQDSSVPFPSELDPKQGLAQNMTSKVDRILKKVPFFFKWLIMSY